MTGCLASVNYELVKSRASVASVENVSINFPCSNVYLTVVKRLRPLPARDDECYSEIVSCITLPTAVFKIFSLLCVSVAVPVFLVFVIVVLTKLSYINYISSRRFLDRIKHDFLWHVIGFPLHPRFFVHFGSSSLKEPLELRRSIQFSQPITMLWF